MKKLLEVGDVIQIKDGMKVYADIPEMYIVSNRSTSRKPTHTLVEIGKEYHNNTDIVEAIKNVSMDIMRSFTSEGFILSLKEAQDFVKDKVIKPTPASCILPNGEYLVVETKYDGGGISHNDTYPDGYHVFCTKLVNGKYDENSFKIDFYQSGSFTVMITDIAPIRKMTKTVNFN